MSTWRQRADEVLREVYRNLPADATIEQCKAAVFEAYPFGPKSHEPYRIWCETARAHLHARFPELRREYERQRMAKLLRKKGLRTRGEA